MPRLLYVKERQVVFKYTGPRPVPSGKQPTPYYEYIDCSAPKSFHLESRSGRELILHELVNMYFIRSEAGSDCSARLVEVKCGRMTC